MRVSRKMRGLRITIFVLTLLNWIVLSKGTDAYAAPVSTPVVLEFEQIFLLNDKVDNKQTTTFAYELQTVKVGNPMPAATVDGIYTIKITGNNTVTTEPIEFSKVGVYEYTLKVSSSNVMTGHTPKNLEYDISIYVKNDGAGGLETVIIVKDNKGNKLDSIEFAYDLLDQGAGSSAGKLDGQKTGSGLKGDNTKTGDEANPYLIGGVFLASLFVVIIVLRKKELASKQES